MEEQIKMEAYKFVKLKKEEFGIKEYIKRHLGKGKISNLDIEYTPVGEKIIISTSKPGLVIGRKGEQIQQLTQILKKRFKLENPHIEISEIENPLLDAQGVADEIALALERMGNLKFKVIAYRKLQEIMKAGALGCELRLSGKLPSERAKSWRFAEGYLKKAGDSAKEVDRAQATGLTKTGIIGVKVAIMPPDARIYDRIIVDDEMRSKLGVVENVEEDEKPKKKRKSSVKSKKRTQNKSVKKEIDVKAEKVALAAGEVAKAEEEKEKSKNDEKVKIPTIEDSKEILYNKLEEVEEEHDNIVDHGDNVNKSEETQDSKN
jgi:small subunit ribosomal protein S3